MNCPLMSNIEKKYCKALAQTPDVGKKLLKYSISSVGQNWWFSPTAQCLHDNIF